MTERRHSAVVITGAGSGMGKAAVHLALERYSTVIAIDNNVDRLADLAAIPAPGSAILPMACDITSAEDVERVGALLADQAEPIDALLNFAGVSDFEAAEHTSSAMWERQLGVNLTGTFHACQTFGRTMIARRTGSIVNVASTAGTFGVPGMAAYSAAKHGVVGLTKALAVEWARYGVRVNCICPGATLTPMLLSTTPEYRAARTKRIPLGRFGEPAEQATVALFLASDSAAYITGAIIPVDGGIAAMAPGTSESALEVEA